MRNLRSHLLPQRFHGFSLEAQALLPALVPEFSGSGSFGPLSSALRKKRLCNWISFKYKLNPVAISVPNKKHLQLCKFFNRGIPCTGHKRIIMVKPLSMPKKEEEDVIMAPPPDVDYGGDDDHRNHNHNHDLATIRVETHGVFLTGENQKGF